MTTIFDVITNINGATFASITTETSVKLKGGKNNPDQGRITKVVSGSNVMLFQNKTGSGYENMVKRRLTEEGKDPESFVLSPRTWGTRLPNLPIVEHNGQYYLEVIFIRSGTVQYKRDGMVCDQQSIQGLPESTEGEQGGLDNKVVIRTYKVDSIRTIVINKQRINLS